MNVDFKFYSCNQDNKYDIKKDPNFTAVHKIGCYIKTSDNAIKKVESIDLLKTLVRKVVMYLNKDYNDNLKRRSGKQVRSTFEKEKVLKDRLVKFFYNRVNDYRNLNKSSSYIVYDAKNPEAYLFTGNTVDTIQNKSKGIKDVNSQIKVLARDLVDFFKIPISQAYIKAKEELSPDMLQAKSIYHETIQSYIKNMIASDPAINKTFNVLFEEVKNKKGNVVGYVLSDAKFSEIKF